MGVRVVQVKFNSGEMAPSMEGQLDHKRYQSGARELLNVIPKSQGGLYRRMGTQFLGFKHDQSQMSVTITHQPALNSTYQIELGNQYGRIWKAGSLVTLTNPENPSAPTLFTTPWSLAEVKELTYSSTVDVMRFYNKKGTKKLARKSVGVSSEDWEFVDYEYRDGPYNPEEETDTLLTVSAPVHILKLTRESAFSAAVVNDYIEYKKKNQWYLARVLGLATVPAAPADPTADVVYVEPVSSIVRGIDTSARMKYSAPEIRSTIRVFNYSLKGSYVRIEDTLAANTVRWARISDYKGLKDYAENIIVNPTSADLVAGRTYRITAYTSGNIISGGFTADALYETFTLQSAYTMSSPVMTLEDLNSLKQLDVVEVETPVTFTSVSDAVAETVYKNEAVLESSEHMFIVGRDEGRFVRLKLGTKFISMKIISVTSSTEVLVTLLSSLPMKDNTNEIVDNGQTTKFRLGTFYTNNYPICGTIHERRHVTGGVPDYPEGLQFSELDKEDVHTPSDEEGTVLSTSAFNGEAASDTLATVRWLKTAVNLVIGSESGEYLLRTLSNGQPITPDNAKITRDSASGSLLSPILVGSTLLFVQRSGAALNQLQFSYETEALDVTRTNTEAEHIFTSNDYVISMAFQQYPDPIIWFTMGNGDIASLTFDKKDQVLAWARHRLGGEGFAEWVSTAPSSDGKRDEVFFSVSRSWGRTYEKLSPTFAPSSPTDKEGMNYLDCSTKYGAGVTELTGLERFNGRTVSLVVDGTQYPDRVVEGGKITLETPTVAYAYVGFRHMSRIRPVVPTLDLGGGDTSAGRLIRISKLIPLVQNTLAMKVAINGRESQAIEVADFTTTDDLMSVSPPLKSGFIEIPTGFNQEYNPDYVIFTDSAYPMSILNLAQEIEYA